MQHAVPGYEALLADTTPVDGVINGPGPETAPALETAPPDGEMGVPYRRPREEFLVAARDPFEVDPAAVERANRGHAHTQNLLADCLKALGLTPRSPASTEPDYDLGWELEESLFVAEIKSVTPTNEEKQLRLGLGQVLRYRYLLARGGRRVTGVLMLEEPPSDRTWPTLCGELGVVLLWPAMLEELPAALSRGHSTASVPDPAAD